MKSGDPLYVPSRDISVAMSLGASFAEGDARLRIPSPLPDGVNLSQFKKWVTPESRVTWLSEFVEMISENDANLLDLAGIIASLGASTGDEAHVVRLYVPRSEMDKARIIPGVYWSRELGMYVADRTASMDLIFPYMTEGMKAVWAMDKNISTEMDSLVKARALMATREEDDDPDFIRELEPGDTAGRRHDRDDE
tara:strand:+ start:1234 stop:1818 length:585 start_codon:yes stop_codon:yes gene_type:complete